MKNLCPLCQHEAYRLDKKWTFGRSCSPEAIFWTKPGLLVGNTSPYGQNLDFWMDNCRIEAAKPSKSPGFVHREAVFVHIHPKVHFLSNRSTPNATNIMQPWR
jgi:hypothetical protein